MVVVTNILMLACVWSAAVAIPTALGEECVRKQIGNLFGVAIELEQTLLVPDVADWQVLVPDNPRCPDEQILGVEVLVCDDVEPTVNFLTKNIIKIHRTGSLQGDGTVRPIVYCNTAQLQNNQPLLQKNQLWSNNLPWERNNNVAHLYAQPLSLSSSLSSLGLASQPLLGKLRKNLWSLPQSAWGQSSQPALTVTPLSQDQSSFGPSPHSVLPSLSDIPVSQGESSFGLRPRSLWDLSHNSLSDLSHQSVQSSSVTPLSQGQSSFGLSPQSELQSLSEIPVSQDQSSFGLRPRSLWDLSHNSLSDLSHQSVQSSLTVTPLSQSQSSLGLSPPSPRGQSQYHRSLLLLPFQSSLPFLGQSSHQLFGQSPRFLGQHSHQLLGQSPRLLGQHSHQLLGQAS